MFIHYNPNPCGSYVGDCAIRAIAIAEKTSWYNVYTDLCMQGLEMCDMPSSNRVWGEYLKERGYIRRVIPNDCPNCYTIKDFCIDHYSGTYILGTGSHVVAIIDGHYYDTWDSGDESPIYYWVKEE